jgi:hypothetical protein
MGKWGYVDIRGAFSFYISGCVQPFYEPFVLHCSSFFRIQCLCQRLLNSKPLTAKLSRSLQWATERGHLVSTNASKVKRYPKCLLCQGGHGWAKDAVLEALKAGYRHLDCAWMYGVSILDTAPRIPHSNSNKQPNKKCRSMQKSEKQSKSLEFPGLRSS